MPMFFEGFLDVFEFVRLNHCFNFFHDVSLSLRFQIVAFFAVQAEIETFDLFLLAHTHARSRRRTS